MFYRSLGFPLLLALLSAWAAAPLWLVEHPAIQDLPQHLAAIRVLSDYGDPALAFSDFFTVELGRTQYLAFYLAAWALCLVLPVLTATKILATVSIVATPFAMRRLLWSLERDERLALFVLPLTWNAHLILGFLNFVAAIPLALFGLALAVELRRRYEYRKAIALAACTFVCFYTHVVPFGFLGLGAALVALGEGPLQTLRRWLPLVPGGVATLFWMASSPAGQATLSASRLGEDAGPEPHFMPWSQALQEIPQWLTDVLHTERDEQLLVGWGVLVIVAIVAGRLGSSAHPSRLARMRLALLPPLAALAYFLAPASYDWIWPINARFPLLALLLLVPFLPSPSRLVGHGLYGALALLSVLSVWEVALAFETFEEEVGELDEAIAAVPEGQKVAGLIFDRGSRAVKFSPFIHSVAWLQAERGGAVMFTFADFPQSPIRFREGERPPRVPPRWEWMPERVDPRRDLDWYDWVLVRGGPGVIARQTDTFAPAFRGPRWSVWRRR